jgi:segregation and condensation protein B
MSLKAKLESVIYAAEEPVTMAQLVGLFADDALEYRAEQKAAAIADAVDGSPDGADASAAPSDEIDYAALTDDPGATTADVVAAFTAEAEAAAATEIEEEAAAAPPEAESSAEDAETESAGPDAEPAAEAGSEATPEPTEADLKREAKQRDREVRAILRQVLDELIAEYEADDRGLEIREIAGGFRMATKPEYHDVVRAFVKSLKPPMKLSLPALETLAVVAYKQPVTAPEVNEIRGVDSSGVFGSLLARKLIATAGRKPVIGRPILYKTTKEFLMRFGLKDLSELPSMEEFEKMAAMEFEESEGAEKEAETQAQPELNEDMSVEEESAAEQASNETEPGGQIDAEPAEPPPTEQ